MRSLLRILLSLSAAVLLLWALAAWGDVTVEDVVATVRRIPLETWALAFAVHCGIYLVRTLRFIVLLPEGERPPFAAVLAVSAAHNLAAYVLPARAGEATFVVYLKGTRGVSAGAGIASLVVSRLLDLATMCAALAAATVWLSRSDAWAAGPGAGLAAGLGLGAVAAALYFASFSGDRFVGLLQGLVRALGLDRNRLGARVLAGGENLGETLRLVRRSGGIPVATLLSFAIWLGVFAFFTVLARGFGLPDAIGLVETGLGASVAVLTNILPINALAGFGTQEWGWTFGFGLIGVERELAISTGVGVHLVQLAHVCVLGVLGHLGMGLAAKRPATAERSE